jgi:chromate reductase, NAD(P)H dehydrogenase (quinone)
MGDALQILGFAGSLRRESFNRALLRAAQELAPTDLSISVFDLTPIPSYNGDVEAAGDPEPVAAFKAAVQQADGLLIATPEYNYSVPGVLKNAIDWASRPSGNSPLRDKPAMLMGASPGASGTMRAQLALRQSFVFTQTVAMLQPEVLVARSQEKFDAQGRLTDEPTRQRLREALGAFAHWIRRLKVAAS